MPVKRQQFAPQPTFWDYLGQAVAGGIGGAIQAGVTRLIDPSRIQEQMGLKEQELDIEVAKSHWDVIAKKYDLESKHFDRMNEKEIAELKADLKREAQEKMMEWKKRKLETDYEIADMETRGKIKREYERGLWEVKKAGIPKVIRYEGLRGRGAEGRTALKWFTEELENASMQYQLADNPEDRKIWLDKVNSIRATKDMPPVKEPKSKFIAGEEYKLRGREVAGQITYERMTDKEMSDSWQDIKKREAAPEKTMTGYKYEDSKEATKRDKKLILKAAAKKMIRKLEKKNPDASEEELKELMKNYSVKTDLEQAVLDMLGQ